MLDRLPDPVLRRCATLPVKPAPVTLTGARVVLRPLDLDADVAALHRISNGEACAVGDRHTLLRPEASEAEVRRVFKEVVEGR